MATEILDTDEDLHVVGDLRTDEGLRAFVFKHYSGGDMAMIDGRIFVDNMQLVFDWIKTGTAPQLSARTRNKLTVVPKGE